MKKFLSVITAISLIFNFCPVTGATENYLEKYKEKCLSILKSKTVLKVAGGLAAGVSGMGILAFIATKSLGHRESEQGGSKKCDDTNDSLNDLIDYNDLKDYIERLKCINQETSDYMDKYINNKDIKNKIEEIKREEKIERKEEIKKLLNTAGIRYIDKSLTFFNEICNIHEAVKEGFYYRHWEFASKLYDAEYKNYCEEKSCEEKSRGEKLKEYCKRTAKDYVIYTFLNCLRCILEYPEDDSMFVTFRSMLNKINCDVYEDELCQEIDEIRWLNL